MSRLGQQRLNKQAVRIIRIGPAVAENVVDTQRGTVLAKGEAAQAAEDTTSEAPAEEAPAEA